MKPRSRDKRLGVVPMDPLLQLAGAVCRQAVEDYYSSDPVVSLDALAWWLDPAGAGLFLGAMNLENDPDLIFRRLINARKSVNRGRKRKEAIDAGRAVEVSCRARKAHPRAGERRREGGEGEQRP